MCRCVGRNRGCLLNLIIVFQLLPVGMAMIVSLWKTFQDVSLCTRVSYCSLWLLHIFTVVSTLVSLCCCVVMVNGNDSKAYGRHFKMFFSALEYPTAFCNYYSVYVFVVVSTLVSLCCCVVMVNGVWRVPIITAMCLRLPSGEMQEKTISWCLTSLTSLSHSRSLVCQHLRVCQWVPWPAFRWWGYAGQAYCPCDVLSGAYQKPVEEVRCGWWIRGSQGHSVKPYG